MGEKTGITWTDHTFNHVWGCKKISPECKYCYAEQRCGDYWNGTYRIFGDKHWNEPVLWDKKAHDAGIRKRVFCASMADFADLESPRSEIDKLWALIKKTPNLDWLLLTKRPENILSVLPDDWGDGYYNVALGVTAGTIKEGLPRLDILRAIPAKMKFISAEPLLEDLGDINLTGFDWLIVGGESGSKARPINPEWVFNLLKIADKSGVPAFFKQWGEYVPFVNTGFNEWVNVADSSDMSLKNIESNIGNITINSACILVKSGKFNIPDTIWNKVIQNEPIWHR